jgi:hypothetical protein
MAGHLARTSAPLALSFGPPSATATLCDRDVLRALMDAADHLGTAPDGGSFLLVYTTPALLRYLTEMDAARENDEPDDDLEPDSDYERSARGALV